MRVAMVACSAPARTAVGNLLAEKVAFFLDRGAEVRVFLESTTALHPHLVAHAEHCPTFPATGPTWDYLAQSDIVFFEFSQGFDLLSLLPLLVDEKPRLVATYYGISPSTGWPGPQRELLERGCRERGLLWCADAVIVHSRSSADELIGATSLPPDRLHQLKVPLDLVRWARSPSPGLGGLSTPLERSVAKQAPVLLFVGRLALNKRLPLVIEALSHLPGVEAWIAGNDRDIYADQARQARDLAVHLGVSDRIRWLGDVSEEDLPKLYHRADVLVLPSIHEGLGIPLLEAQAAGLPVVAARAAALPETIADAGLTFRTDDLDDFVRQLRRVLVGRVFDPSLTDGSKTRPTTLAPRTKRIALVAFRFGDGFVGGAETSLRNIGHALQRQGYVVEVFTTCTIRESDWKNDLPAGDTTEHGFLVHRFPIDPHDRPRHDEAFRTILESNGNVSPAIEAEYLAHSIQSSALMGVLGSKRDEFDALITGPYLHGLTFRVAQAFPDKTLVLPCFHDEPAARLQSWLDVYGAVAGLLYHTPEEQDFAQSALGLNHPGAALIGTCLPAVPEIDKNENRPRTLVYCGRYSPQKNLPLMLEFASRYQAQHPHRFRWVFIGEGNVRLPKEPWLDDKGRVSNDEKHGILAQADALVQLSTHESLSLVVLEAWQNATPVIVHTDARVLVGHIGRSGGGIAVGDYDAFARALDDLWANPKEWNEHGRRGQCYTRDNYLDKDSYDRRLTGALEMMALPLAEKMRRRGLRRAQDWDRSVWREQFGQFIERTLDAPARGPNRDLVLEPLSASVHASIRQASFLLPLRIHNRGNVPATSGFAATRIETVLRDQTGLAVQAPRSMPLPDLILPGRTATVMVPVDLPQIAGRFELTLEIFDATGAQCGRGKSREPDAQSDGDLEPGATESPSLCASGSLTLPVNIGDNPHYNGLAGGIAPLLEAAQVALAEAHARQALPRDYVDVCEGRFARAKRWLKQKLLNNFKRAYVDVLSAQQSDVNRRLVESVQQLTECCRALDQTVRCLQEQMTSTPPAVAATPQFALNSGGNARSPSEDSAGEFASR